MDTFRAEWTILGYGESRQNWVHEWLCDTEQLRRIRDMCNEVLNEHPIKQAPEPDHYEYDLYYGEVIIIRRWVRSVRGEPERLPWERFATFESRGEARNVLHMLRDEEAKKRRPPRVIQDTPLPRS